MNLSKVKELITVLKSELKYEDANVLEMIIEEFRLDCNQAAEVVESCFYPKGSNKIESAIGAFNLLKSFYLIEEERYALAQAYDLNDSQLDNMVEQAMGKNIYLTIHTYIRKVRANDFGNEYRCYLWLDDIGNGNSGWGYFIPDTAESSFMMNIAIEAKIKEQPLYVFGCLDENQKKIRITELGLKSK